MTEFAFVRGHYPLRKHEYKHGESASHTDKDGYTVTVRSRKDAKELLKDPNDSSGTASEGLRRGVKSITDPKGKTKTSGYWMDYPEDDEKPEAYYAKSTKQRLQDEADRQATRYDPLREQFKRR